MTKWDSGKYASMGPTIDDCERLWTSIRHDLISDARIAVIIPTIPIKDERPVVRVESPGIDPDTGGEKIHVWATKDLGNLGPVLSHSQLYDLLMVAYKNMEAFLGGQAAF